MATCPACGRSRLRRMEPAPRAGVVNFGFRLAPVREGELVCRRCAEAVHDPPAPAPALSPAELEALVERVRRRVG